MTRLTDLLFTLAFTVFVWVCADFTEQVLDIIRAPDPIVNTAPVILEQTIYTPRVKK